VVQAVLAEAVEALAVAVPARQVREIGVVARIHSALATVVVAAALVLLEEIHMYRTSAV
jgi:hypothetical protein